MEEEKVTVNGIPLSVHLGEEEKKRVQVEAHNVFDETLTETRRSLTKKAHTKYRDPITRGGAVHYKEEESGMTTIKEQAIDNQEAREKAINDLAASLRGRIQFDKGEQEQRLKAFFDWIVTEQIRDGFFSIQKHIRGGSAEEVTLINRRFGQWSHGKDPWTKTVMYQDLTKMEKMGLIHHKGEGQKKSYYLGPAPKKEKLPEDDKDNPKTKVMLRKGESAANTHDEDPVQTIYVDLVIRVRVEVDD